MKYDFTTVYDRKGKDAAAVDTLGLIPGHTPSHPKNGFDVISMWLADMNFATVPTIPEAMIERASHPLFGYYQLSPEYFQSIIRWQKERNGVENLTPECIGFENGVLGGVLSALNVLASRGDKVMLHSPTYIGFTFSLINCGYSIVHSPLYLDENNIWRMDFEDMERRIIQEKIHVMIFCSPHNPTGRVWERWELEKAMEIFKKHDVYVISDEIWSDILLNGHKHIPLQSISEDARNRTIAFYSPSKTFNAAGLVGAYHVIYNKTIRDRHEKEQTLSHYNAPNVMSMHTLIGAYKPEGAEWVDELCQVLTENINYGVEYIEKHFKGVSISKPQGTYVLFLDCTQWCAEHHVTIYELEQMCWDVGVALQDGCKFHGPCHLRMNLASPFSLIKEAFDRLDRYVFNAER